jgi:demethylmenaquinone methyltransferase/2-methoxy-6-polyprenyl-1,4-benzoquinol methylase
MVTRDERAGRAEAARLQGLDLEAHLADPALKQRFVTPMFDVIAPRYDAFTRIFSFGMDRGWKRELLDEVRDVAPADAVVVDLACGTGDLAFDMALMLPGARVTGIDASSAMIALAAERRGAVAGDRVSFAVGDMSQLELSDASVDVITAGYGFRNVPDYELALREAARVLRPGGHLLTLDFHRPENPVWRRLLVGYLTAAGSVIGWLWHRAPVIYAYLGPSVEHFVSWQGFSRALERSGFAVERVATKLLGGIAIFSARKRAPAPVER